MCTTNGTKFNFEQTNVYKNGTEDHEMSIECILYFDNLFLAASLVLLELKRQQESL
jgi:hypothetical protein